MFDEISKALKTYRKYELFQETRIESKISKKKLVIVVGCRWTVFCVNIKYFSLFEYSIFTISKLFVLRFPHLFQLSTPFRKLFVILYLRSNFTIFTNCNIYFVIFYFHVFMLKRVILCFRVFMFS